MLSSGGSGDVHRALKIRVGACASAARERARRERCWVEAMARNAMWQTIEQSGAERLAWKAFAWIVRSARGPRAALHVETPHLRSKRGRRADRGALQEARGAERSPIAEARVAARRGCCAPTSNQRATRSSCHPPVPIERSRRGRFEPSTPTHQPHIDESEAFRLRPQPSHGVGG